MASRVHDPGLKARYVESTNHWRRLAEQFKQLEFKQLEKRGLRPARAVDCRYGAGPLFTPGNSILEVRGAAAVCQIAQSPQDDGKPDNTADHQERPVPRHSVQHRDAVQKEDVENLRGRRDDAKRQEAQAGHNFVAQIDARRDLLTALWECLLL
jgi:hypothetical protein